jgi:hypothetical protein
VKLPRSKWLWILIGAGTVGRLIWAFASYGHYFDIESYLIVDNAVIHDPLHFYSQVTFVVGDGIEQFRWPYPPLFVSWILAAGGLDGPTGLPFHGLIQLPSILADAAIALLVYGFLRLRGAPERSCLIGAGLVAFGPPFAVISGYHGQIDSLAILPAVAALYVWELRPSRRALTAGLLIGIGAAVKTVPLLMLLALVPAARDRREAAVLVTAALAVPALLLAPFLIADPNGASAVIDYSGAPGLGGLSLVIQPNLAADWLTVDRLHLTSASQWLVDLNGIPVMAALAATGLFLLRYRPSPIDAAVLVWLVVYAFSPNLFLQYAIWGLPFLLAAGYLRTTFVVEAWLVIPFVLTYATIWESRDIALIYSPMVIALWAASLAGAVLLARRMVAGRRSHRTGVQPPLVTLGGPPAAPAPRAPSRTAPDTA